MIELVILNHLKDGLDVPVFMEKPTNAPSEYVLFEKTGGGRNETMPSATFAFQSYSTSLFKAAVLNEAVKNEVDHLVLLDEIRGVTLNTDYNFTDTTTKQYRYQAVYDIKHY
jgi:hypothetical protein